MMNTKKNKDHPLISVIIPVYNGERYLAEAIESSRAQSYSPLEIIVIDDGSTDASAGIAHRYQGIRYFYQSNAGLSSALNKGLENARGDYFAFLDADDFWLAGKLVLQMAVFNEHPGLDAVFGYHERFFHGDCRFDPGDKPAVKQGSFPALLKDAMLIKREAFYRVGLFDTTLRMGDFLDWYKRALEQQLNFITVPEVLFKRRIHDDNSSSRNRDDMKDYLRIIKSSLDRQRRKISNGTDENT